LLLVRKRTGATVADVDVKGRVDRDIGDTAQAGNRALFKLQQARTEPAAVPLAARPVRAGV
jgi:hypothetical protein